jgi:hypothetical protein
MKYDRASTQLVPGPSLAISMHLGVQLAILLLLGSILAALVFAIGHLGHRLEALTDAVRALGALQRSAEHPKESAPRRGLEAVFEALGADDLVLAQARIDAIEPELEESERRALLAASAELSRRKEAAAARLRASLDAARSVSDPDAVLALHAQLAAIISPVEREALEREHVRWFVALLMRRMRSGTVRPDVALLAQRVAETFPNHPEGASLRASLPTLRRSAGLCASCGQPYRGIEDSCPECLGGRMGPVEPEPESAWSEPDEGMSDAEDSADGEDRLLFDRPAPPPGSVSAT